MTAAKPKLVMFDKTHCISEWGHDFQPDSLRLGLKIAELGRPIILGLTATVGAQGELRQYEATRLEMMGQYAEMKTCRRVLLLRYSDQDAPEGCGSCDSGLTDEATVDSQHFPDKPR